jgi:anti-sigma regulatory factor (Ser/Thr protein kinase)
MAHSTLAELAGDVHAPARARRLAAAFLADHAPRATGVPSGPADDVATVISELVTNSVRAGARTISVQLSVEGARMRIEVTDEVSGWPRVREASPDAPVGRGLRLVAALSEGWGVSRVRGGGKLVWATVRLD